VSDPERCSALLCSSVAMDSLDLLIADPVTIPVLLILDVSGGIIEAAICYTGDVSNPNARYNLDYYLDFAR